MQPASLSCLGKATIRFNDLKMQNLHATFMEAKRSKSTNEKKSELWSNKVYKMLSGLFKAPK
jgi:hypothetical protein